MPTPYAGERIVCCGRIALVAGVLLETTACSLTISFSMDESLADSMLTRHASRITHHARCPKMSENVRFEKITFAQAHAGPGVVISRRNRSDMCPKTECP